MDLRSFAAQAIAFGPRTLAPPSFEGHGWLVVVNMMATTTASILGAMLAVKLIKDWWRHRVCGMEALTLWGWNPRDPVGTAWYLTAQRLVAPFGRLFTFGWIGLYVLAEPAMIAHLRKQPFPLRMWRACGCSTDPP